MCNIVFTTSFILVSGDELQLQQSAPVSVCTQPYAASARHVARSAGRRLQPLCSWNISSCRKHFMLLSIIHLL